MTGRCTLRPLSVTAATAAVLALSITLARPARPSLVWNVTASAPVGLYIVEQSEPIARGDLVALLPPAPLAEWLANRGYLSPQAPLLKRIEALPPDRVCRSGSHVTVNGRRRAVALEMDANGRALPSWHGCVSLHSGQVFVLKPGVASSLDGRYFGPLPGETIIGRATLVWSPEGR